MSSLKIIPFEPQYTRHFRELNIQWLEKYFYVEKKDVELLEDSKKNIIDKGGYIFFAEFDQIIVGCFSFIKLNDKTYELGKMAVDPEFQGLKIGQTLLNFAVDYAKRNNWSQIILYSSTKLDTALHIYRKHGFRQVVLENNSIYARSDIKMELNLLKTPVAHFDSFEFIFAYNLHSLPLILKDGMKISPIHPLGRGKNWRNPVKMHNGIKT